MRTTVNGPQNDLVIYGQQVFYGMAEVRERYVKGPRHLLVCGAIELRSREMDHNVRKLTCYVKAPSIGLCQRSIHV